MDLKISIFDFFSFLVPGFLYLISILLLLHGIIDFSFVSRVITPNIQDLVYLTIFSYILGQLGDTLYKFNPVTYILFIRVRHYSNAIYDKFLAEHKLNKDKHTYRYMRRYITVQNKKLITQIEKHLAMKIFMRNLSLSFLFLSASTFLYLHNTKNLSYIFYVPLTLVAASLVSGIKSTKYAKWANRSILDSYEILKEEVKRYDVNKYKKP